MKNAIRLVVTFALSATLAVAAPPKKTAAPRKFIDPQNMDSSVKPGNDFYRYANGNWLKANPIPASKTSWGSFNELRERSSEAMKTLLEDAAKNTAKSRLHQLVGDFYASGMDSSFADRFGAEAIRPDLMQVDRLTTKETILNEMAQLRAQGTGMLFGFFVAQDRKNPAKYLPQLGQGGTTLPDRDYYLKNDARSQKIRDAYRNHLTKMFGLVGEETTRASQNADVVVRLETALAKAQMARVEMRDPYKTYNKLAVPAFSRITPGINWATQLSKFGVTGQDTVLVSSPAFFKAVDSLITATPVDELKTYMRWNILKNAAPYLGKDFVDQNFAFSKVLTGQKSKPRAGNGSAA